MSKHPYLSPTPVLVSVTAVLLAASCGEPGHPGVGPWQGSIDTLANGRIVVQNPDEPLVSPARPLELVELWRVGALQGAGPDVFGEIRDVELGARGDLYVLDAQASEIRAFDSAGAFVRRFGRAGEGPGEMQTPAGMTIGPSGALWVMDWGNARFTAFDPASGEIVDEVRRQATFTAIPWPGLFDDSGRLVDLGLDGAGEPAVLRLDATLTPTDTTLRPMIDDEHRITFRRDGLTVMTTVDPFTPQPTWAPHPLGGLIVGEGAPYRLHRVGFEGDTTLTLSIAREPERVTDQERDSALAAFEESAASIGGVADRRPRIPSTKPLHGPVFVDDMERIWVGAVGARDTMWDLFAADGRFLAQLVIPLSPTFVRPVVRDGRLAMVARPSDVPTVIVYALPEVLR